ncbi:MAG: PD40 domain-containing protein [Victivallales bacterium]|nr:PD40 domain-containing protein [Victivallales bacterium]
MKKVLFALWLLAACVPFVLQAQNVLSGTVTKHGTHGNPSLGIVSFSGDAATRQTLERVLQRTDWFTIVGADQAALAQIQLKVSGSPQNLVANVAVAGKSSFTISGTGETTQEAVFQLVDALLKQVFKVPALCTRPIAYVCSSSSSTTKEIFLCNIDGSNHRRLTHNGKISTEPSWGHSRALVYTHNSGTSLNIVLVDIGKDRQRVVSSARGLNSSAALSQNGRTLALSMSLGKQVDLYTIDLATNTRTRLTQDRNVESSPVFSPDGKELCYVSDKSGRAQLYVIPVAGGTERRLTTQGARECVSPDWSVVSNQICFSMRTSSGQYVIAVLDMRKPDATPVIITEAAGNWEAPSWAPDGRHIVCTRQSGKNQDLYIVDSWFHTFQQLTKDARVSLPAWAPAY